MRVIGVEALAGAHLGDAKWLGPTVAKVSWRSFVNVDFHRMLKSMRCSALTEHS